MKRMYVVHALLAALVTLLSVSGCGRAAGVADDLAVPVREAAEVVVKEGAEAAAKEAAEAAAQAAAREAAEAAAQAAAREAAEAAAQAAAREAAEAAARKIDSISSNIIQYYEIPISQGPNKDEITAKLKNVMNITFCFTITYGLTSDGVKDTLVEVARNKELNLAGYEDIIANGLREEAAALQKPQRQQDLKDIYEACGDLLGT